MHATMTLELDGMQMAPTDLSPYVHTSNVAPLNDARALPAPYLVHVSNTWAEFVKAQREMRGWSQERLADEAQVSRYTILRWEQGRRSDPDSVVAVAQVLGLDPVDAFRMVGFLPGAPVVQIETDPDLVELERQMAIAKRAMQRTPDPALRARFARQLADLTNSFNELAQYVADRADENDPPPGRKTS